MLKEKLQNNQYSHIRPKQTKLVAVDLLDEAENDTDTKLHSPQPNELVEASNSIKISRGRNHKDERRSLSYSPLYSIDEMLSADGLLIRRSWRSLIYHWALFPVLGFLAVFLSDTLPWSVLENLFLFGNQGLVVTIPIFVLPLLILLLHALWKIYNDYLILDLKYLIYYRGNLSLAREMAEMEISRMQVITVKQSPMESLFDVGTVSVATFTRRNFEFDLEGVIHPHRLARIIKLAVRRAREMEKDATNADAELAYLEKLAESA